MKTILVDGIHVLMKEGGGLNSELYQLLESYPNPKVIATGANEEQMKKYGLDNPPYPVYSGAHNPEKTDPEFYKRFMREHKLHSEDVVMFDQAVSAVRSAGLAGIPAYCFNVEVGDLLALKSFLDSNT
jgi:FMN phosphatase YigB (HAD superfamily)